MASRTYPTNAQRGGSATLVGAGNAADVFTFPNPVIPVVQNNIAATTIYVAGGDGTGTAATQGDEAIATGATWQGKDMVSWIAIYGTAATKVNGTSTGAIVVYGIG